MKLSRKRVSRIRKMKHQTKKKRIKKGGKKRKRRRASFRRNRLDMSNKTLRSSFMAKKQRGGYLFETTKDKRIIETPMLIVKNTLYQMKIYNYGQQPDPIFMIPRKENKNTQMQNEAKATIIVRWKQNKPIVAKKQLGKYTFLKNVVKALEISIEAAKERKPEAGSEKKKFEEYIKKCDSVMNVLKGMTEDDTKKKGQVSGRQTINFNNAMEDLQGKRNPRKLKFGIIMKTIRFLIIVMEISYNNLYEVAKIEREERLKEKMGKIKKILKKILTDKNADVEKAVDLFKVLGTPYDKCAELSLDDSVIIWETMTELMKERDDLGTGYENRGFTFAVRNIYKIIDWVKEPNMAQCNPKSSKATAKIKRVLFKELVKIPHSSMILLIQSLAILYALGGEYKELAEMFFPDIIKKIKDDIATKAKEQKRKNITMLHNIYKDIEDLLNTRHPMTYTLNIPDMKKRNNALLTELKNTYSNLDEWDNKLKEKNIHLPKIPEDMMTNALNAMDALRGGPISSCKCIQINSVGGGYNQYGGDPIGAGDAKYFKKLDFEGFLRKLARLYIILISYNFRAEKPHDAAHEMPYVLASSPRFFSRHPIKGYKMLYEISDVGQSDTANCTIITSGGSKTICGPGETICGPGTILNAEKTTEMIYYMTVALETQMELEKVGTAAVKSLLPKNLTDSVVSKNLSLECVLRSNAATSGGGQKQGEYTIKFTPVATYNAKCEKRNLKERKLSVGDILVWVNVDTVKYNKYVYPDVKKMFGDFCSEKNDGKCIVKHRDEYKKWVIGQKIYRSEQECCDNATNKGMSKCRYLNTNVSSINETLEKYKDVVEIWKEKTYSNLLEVRIKLSAETSLKGIDQFAKWPLNETKSSARLIKSYISLYNKNWGWISKINWRELMDQEKEIKDDGGGRETALMNMNKVEKVPLDSQAYGNKFLTFLSSFGKINDKNSTKINEQLVGDVGGIWTNLSIELDKNKPGSIMHGLKNNTWKDTLKLTPDYGKEIANVEKKLEDAKDKLGGGGGQSGGFVELVDVTTPFGSLDKAHPKIQINAGESFYNDKLAEEIWGGGAANQTDENLKKFLTKWSGEVKNLVSDDLEKTGKTKNAIKKEMIQLLSEFKNIPRTNGPAYIIGKKVNSKTYNLFSKTCPHVETNPKREEKVSKLWKVRNEQLKNLFGNLERVKHLARILYLRNNDPKYKENLQGLYWLMEDNSGNDVFFGTHPDTPAIENGNVKDGAGTIGEIALLNSVMNYYILLDTHFLIMELQTKYSKIFKLSLYAGSLAKLKDQLRSVSCKTQETFNMIGKFNINTHLAEFRRKVGIVKNTAGTKLQGLRRTLIGIGSRLLPGGNITRSGNTGKKANTSSGLFSALSKDNCGALCKKNIKDSITTSFHLFPIYGANGTITGYTSASIQDPPGDPAHEIIAAAAAAAAQHSTNGTTNTSDNAQRDIATAAATAATTAAATTADKSAAKCKPGEMSSSECKSGEIKNGGRKTRKGGKKRKIKSGKKRKTRKL